MTERVTYLTMCTDPESADFEAMQANTVDFDVFEEAYRFANNLLITPTENQRVVGVPMIEVI